MPAGGGGGLLCHAEQGELCVSFVIIQPLTVATFCASGDGQLKQFRVGRSVEVVRCRVGSQVRHTAGRTGTAANLTLYKRLQHACSHRTGPKDTN